jgi:hypothetical protein
MATWSIAFGPVTKHIILVEVHEGQNFSLHKWPVNKNKQVGDRVPIHPAKANPQLSHFLPLNPTLLRLHNLPIA